MPVSSTAILEVAVLSFSITICKNIKINKLGYINKNKTLLINKAIHKQKKTHNYQK